MRYDQGLIGRCKAADLCPVTIAIGREIEWQGGVSREVQLHLLSLLQSCQADFPPEMLPPAVSRVKPSVDLLGTPPVDPSATPSVDPSATPSADPTHTESPVDTSPSSSGRRHRK